jgi:hypothetical protein
MKVARCNNNKAMKAKKQKQKKTLKEKTTLNEKRKHNNKGRKETTHFYAIF